jgi:glycerol-3-phosphate acyltransferase PlsY
MNSLSFTALLSVIWILLSYLLGSIPVGLLLAKARGRDPRRVGSGNIGATNVMRTAGKTVGVVTLLGDALKGFLPAWLAIGFGFPEQVAAGAACAAFLGHVFPLYLRFKGGKGIATALGVFLAFNYVAVCVDVVVFAIILFRWRYVSLASLVCSALMPIILVVLGSPWSNCLLAVFIALVVVAKHRDNIRRLMAGKENRITAS